MTLLLALTASGCHWVFPYTGAKTDDKGKDVPQQLDQGVERRDLADDIQTLDKRIVDVRFPDGRIVDGKLPSDGHPDVLPPLVCYKASDAGSVTVKGFVTHGKYVMRACEYAASAGPITQCAAFQTCTSPWALCTVENYEGATNTAPPISTGKTPSGMEWGWLAACIRKGGGAVWEKAVCGNCTTTKTKIAPSNYPLTKDCTPDSGMNYPSNPTEAVSNYIGLTSYTLDWCWYPPPISGRSANGKWAPCPTDGNGEVGGNGKTGDHPRRALCCYKIP